MAENTFAAEELTKELERRGYVCIVEEGEEGDALIHVWKNIGDETITISGGVWDPAEPLSSFFTTSNQMCDVWEDRFDANGEDKGEGLGFTSVDEGSSLSEIADIVDDVYDGTNGTLFLG